MRQRWPICAERGQSEDDSRHGPALGQNDRREEIGGAPFRMYTNRVEPELPFEGARGRWADFLIECAGET
jgi:hypothetical protein